MITPSLIVAIGHIHAEAGTPTLGIGSALWGQQHLFLGENETASSFMMVSIDSIFAVFDITPAPSR